MDIKGAGKWALLSVVYLILALAFLWGRWEFAYAIPYILGFASVAIVLSSDEPELIAAMCAALIGLTSVAISEPISGLLASSAAWISGVLFAILLLNEFGVFKEYSPYSTKTAKYLVLVSFLAWFFWALNYFISRIIYWPTPTAGLPFETVLNHGGIMLLALNEALALLGIKYKNQEVVSVIFALIAILGAFLLVTQLGWGLHLLP